MAEVKEYTVLVRDAAFYTLKRDKKMEFNAQKRLANKINVLLGEVLLQDTVELYSLGFNPDNHHEN